MGQNTTKRKLIPNFREASEDSAYGASQFRYRGIWRWAVAATFGVSAIPLIILAIWNLFQYQKALEAEIMFPIHNIVSNAKSSLLLFLDERKSTLKFIAYDNSLDSLCDHERLAAVFSNMKVALGDIVDLGVITSDGEQVAYVGPYELGGIDYEEERWFKEVVTRNEYISDVFLGVRDYPHIVIAIKRETENGDFFILRATLDTQKFNNIVSSLSLRPTSDAFLINEKGMIQTPSKYHGPVLSEIGFAIPPVSPQSQVKEIQDLDGAKAIIGYSHIEGTAFTFLVIKHHRELMRNLETFLGELIGFLMVSIVLILLVILRISTIMVEKIREADRKRIMVLREIEHTAKMASIGRLAAGVAHEINNPLAVINEKAGLIKDLFDTTPDLPQREMFLKQADSIINSVKRCSTITYRLLGFARHIDVQIEFIDLKELIEEVLGFLGKEAEYRSIQVNLEVGENVPPIQSDRGQLQQVFLNIINNAFAAVSDGGQVNIDIRTHTDNKIALSVEDNGIGIRKEDLSRVFEPFFTTKGGKGTGLGLSITYGIVNKLNGNIEVKSKKNEGTTVTVILPIHKL